MTELRQLTSARGIAAWLVVLYHIRLSIAGLPRWAAAVLDKGYLAVDFFFLLSGFVIWLTWHDRLRAGNRATIVRFLQKRIARIWPLHLAMLAAAVMLALALAVAGRSDPVFPFAELPLHLLLVQNWGFTRELHWNDPGLVDQLRTRRLSAVPRCSCAGWIGGICPPECCSSSPPCCSWRSTSSWRISRRSAPIFPTSVSFAASANSPPARSSLPSGCGARAERRCRYRWLCWQRGGWVRVETLVVPAALAALLLALARSTFLLQGRTIHWLGEISYATYLSHYLLWKIVKLAFVADPTAVSPVLIAIYLLLVLTASAILYRGVERPAQRLINALPLGVRRAPRPVLPSAPR